MRTRLFASIPIAAVKLGGHSHTMSPAPTRSAAPAAINSTVTPRLARRGTAPLLAPPVDDAPALEAEREPEPVGADV